MLDIINKNPLRMSRKHQLEPIAKKMNIDASLYKNRTHLHNAIIEKLNTQEITYENHSDPITLQPITQIEKKYLFTWEQNQKWYAADIRSLKAMVSKNMTVLPWAIDYSTGVGQSQNRDHYNNTFDMKNVIGLIDRIKMHNVDNLYDFEYESVPESTMNRFQLENSTSQYISHIIDYLYTHSNHNRLLYAALVNVANQYGGETFHSTHIDLSQINNLYSIQLIAQRILQIRAKNGVHLCILILNTIKEHIKENTQNVIDLFFMELDNLLNQ